MKHVNCTGTDLRCNFAHVVIVVPILHIGLHEIENEILGVKRSLLQKKTSMYSERWECIENAELVSFDAVQFVLGISV